MNFEVDFNGKVQLGEILAVGAPKKNAARKTATMTNSRSPIVRHW
jgi:hypothetical protein